LFYLYHIGYFILLNEILTISRMINVIEKNSETDDMGLQYKDSVIGVELNNGHKKDDS